MAGRCFLFAMLTALTLASLGRAAELDLSAEKAREVLHKHCAACHTGTKPPGRRRLTEPAELKELVKPGKPEASELLQLIECGSEPRGNRPKVPAAEVEILRDWIKRGAAPFAPLKSDEYVLTQILLDQRPPGRGTSGDRYFAFNHLLDNAETDRRLFAEALMKGLGLLSWMNDVAKPVPIDPAGTIFRVDLHALGWDDNPYRAAPNFNLFDLVLLEYPFAVLPKASPVFDALDREYIKKAKMVRPVPFVRGDWFLSAAGRPPLYYDLTRLPATLPGVQKKLGVTDSERTRITLAESGELRIPRLLERGSAGRRVFWRTYDLPSAKSVDDVENGAAKKLADGEAIFSRPNGLPGFFNARADGTRTDGPNRDVWKAGDPPLTGFACLRCHGGGVLNRTGTADNERFAEALANLHTKPANVPPGTGDSLAEVIRRFRPSETPRDVHELPPLDGLMQRKRDRQPPLMVELATFDGKGQKQAMFKPGDPWYFSVANKGTQDVFIEVVAIDRLGILDLVTGASVKLAAGATWRFPPQTNLKVPDKEGAGKSLITLFASDQEFAPGVKLTANEKLWTLEQQPKSKERDKEIERAKKAYVDESPDFVADRLVHRFVDRSGEEKSRIDFRCDPTRMIKQTVEVEIRSK